MPNQPKVFVIGLDCAAPELVFDEWKDQLPHLSRLMDEGSYGKLESIIPPITVPAWMCMMTGLDPGRLGFYGFRNRANYSYEDLAIVDSRSVKEQTLWDILARYNKKSVVIGIPPSYPPRPINGSLVTCFMTPSTTKQYTYPPALKAEIDNLVGEYIVDVRKFRTEDKDYLLRQIYEMTERRFKVVRHLLTEKEWDFFIFMEIGIDRIHHGFWKFRDKEHRKHSPDSPYKNSIRDYYIYIDEEIGKTLELLDDDTAVLVVSDHGAKRMDGGICINEWLIEEGYLKIKRKPEGIVQIEEVEVDWENTKAWGSGGYYGRLFLNVSGREPTGVIPPGDYEKVRDELVSKLEALTDENGNNIGTRVYKPQEIYSECHNIPSDLIIHFGDLYWRSVGGIGIGDIRTFETDLGPDDANHAQHGLFIAYDPQNPGRGRKLESLHLLDIAPTVLNLFDIKQSDSRADILSG